MELRQETFPRPEDLWGKFTEFHFDIEILYMFASSCLQLK